MSTRARLQNANDSASLWNYNICPGWSPFDAHVLRLGLMKYGCGAWKQINYHFPGKNKNQLNQQTQRLFGQQALNEFSKLHIDPTRVKDANDLNVDAFRKNACIINTGNNLTNDQLKECQRQNQAKYGIPQAIYERIVVPVVMDRPTPCVTLVDECEKLREMYRCVHDIELRLEHLQRNGGKDQTVAAKMKNQSKSRKEKKEKNKENQAKNANANKKKQSDKTDDVEMGNEAKDTDAKENEAEQVPMDEDTAMAMALSLSASMEAANIDTPAIEKKAKKKSKKAKKSTTKKKAAKGKSRRSKKRKKMEDDDAEYVPGPAAKKAKTK